MQTIDVKQLADTMVADTMVACNGTTGQSLYVTGPSGNRSSQACIKFIDAGFENVVNVEGGESCLA